MSKKLLKKYHVHAPVHATKYLGEFEAVSKADAIKQALKADGGVSVCHQCSSEINAPELDYENVVAEEV